MYCVDTMDRQLATGCRRGHSRATYGYLQPDGRYRCRECRRLWIVEYRKEHRSGSKAGLPRVGQRPSAPRYPLAWEDALPPIASDEPC